MQCFKIVFFRIKTASKEQSTNLGDPDSVGGEAAPRLPAVPGVSTEAMLDVTPSPAEHSGLELSITKSKLVPGFEIAFLGRFFSNFFQQPFEFVRILSFFTIFLFSGRLGQTRSFSTHLRKPRLMPTTTPNPTTSRES